MNIDALKQTERPPGGDDGGNTGGGGNSGGDGGIEDDPLGQDLKAQPLEINNERINN